MRYAKIYKYMNQNEPKLHVNSTGRTDNINGRKYEENIKHNVQVFTIPDNVTTYHRTL